MTRKTNIPQKVRDAASGLIALGGDYLKLIGKYKGQDAYHYAEPDADTGFPFVFLYDGSTVTEISGFEALDITASLVKD